MDHDQTVTSHQKIDVATARLRPRLLHGKAGRVARPSGRNGPAVKPAVTLLGEPDARPIVDPTVYDTAWLATIPSPKDPRIPRYPRSLEWVERQQRPDGSWGGDLRYEHDRVISTLAALVALASFDGAQKNRERIERGTRYLWRNGHRLATEPVELVGFELLLPSMIERARGAGISTPPFLDVYGPQRLAKLRLIPPDVMYSPHATIVHSLEFLGEQASVEGLRRAQFPNGSIGNSPAATAFFATLTADARALGYLDECQSRGDGSVVPVLYPCETFELVWAAYHLFLAGVHPRELLTSHEQILLAEGLAHGGVSLSPTFAIPDADDTAVSLLLLHGLGRAVDARVLEQFARSEGHFVSFPLERHPSVGVNLHVLHALLRIPGYPDHARVVARLVDFIVAEQRHGAYWVDKWHISPYYATSHALRVLGELPPDLAERARPALVGARDWLRQTQSSGGSWGFGENPTAEETAYAVLGLTAPGCQPVDLDASVVAHALGVLEEAARADNATRVASLPPQWIDKCLYSPRLVVGAVIDSAILLLRQRQFVLQPAA